MSDGFVKCKPPTPSKYLSKKSVLIAIGIFGFLLSIAIIIGKNNRELKKVDSSSLKSYPTSALSSLPSNYSEVRPPRPDPTPNVIQNDPVDSELLKRLARLREERLKRADEARRSGISFQSVSISNDALKGVYGSSRENEESNSSATLNPRDSDNRQDEKKDFLETTKSGSTLLKQNLKKPLSPFQIMGGTVISGTLITGINSDLPGEIVGQVSQNVFDTVSGAHLLIPQGTKILGQYDSRIVYGQERVLVVWTRLIFPNGKSIMLEGMPGVDLSGYAGLSDQVNNHYLRLLTGVVFSSMLSAGAQMANGRSFNSINPSFDELAMQGVARNLNNVGQQITNKNLNIQPTLEIRPGFRFNVFVNKDMVLEPYEL
ncbi:MAG TPA: TrbI/VirB10 family protein [Oligoflexia bacterium]|nr:TrbI/VirB10 family protein [Oligoflexia bacterium]HMP49141.1 TrbI/VirB10 family protein [Oligoflexia bacterium]